jgi:hypothetical protein
MMKHGVSRLAVKPRESRKRGTFFLLQILRLRRTI